ncbi:MAG: hypothetical protein JJT81_20535 [Rubellimicrobium sp.]|nr:hypothetical protein [Rubellimicrobium sp.]
MTARDYAAGGDEVAVALGGFTRSLSVQRKAVARLIGGGTPEGAMP